MVTLVIAPVAALMVFTVSVAGGVAEAGGRECERCYCHTGRAVGEREGGAVGGGRGHVPRADGVGWLEGVGARRQERDAGDGARGAKGERELGAQAVGRLGV